MTGCVLSLGAHSIINLVMHRQVHGEPARPSGNTDTGLLCLSFSGGKSNDLIGLTNLVFT